MIDLHLHLDGSMTPELILKLAKEQNVKLPADNKDDLKKFLSVPKECESLNDYLKCFELPLSVLQTKKAITEAVYNLQENLKKQGLIYAEIRFAPQLHGQKGLSQKEVVEAAIKGLKKSDFKANLILCCMRGDDNEKENLETIDVAKEYLGKGVCAVDLAGAEALYKTKNFKNVFDKARENKIPFTIHAGEADGPESIKSAIEFGAKRIGHGIHGILDNSLMKTIIDNKIPLEICPTSNFQTKTMATYDKYPIKKFLDMGVKVTVNTDNMTVSDVNIYQEYEFLKKHFNITNKDIYKMVNNAIDVAFISEKEKKELRSNLKNRLNKNNEDALTC